MSITLVIGGARSGKSTFAQEICTEQSIHVAYIACGISTDDDMEARIQMHINQRPKTWKTIEKYSDFGELPKLNDYINSDCILLDCITTMISNLMLDEDIDYDTCTMDVIYSIESSILKQIDTLLDTIAADSKHLVIVTNEVGLSVVPAYRLGNIFRDIAGRANAHIAKRADSVYMLVAGIPMKIK